MSGPRLNAAFYAAPVEEFLSASDEEVYAPLASPHGYTLAPEQLSAWHLQLPVLRAALADLPAGADAAGFDPATINPAECGTGSYSPTPTIIEAARRAVRRSPRGVPLWEGPLVAVLREALARDAPKR
jgi:hypothetical protein